MNKDPASEQASDKGATVVISHNHYLSTLVVTGLVVFLMVYVVMPRYTKLIQRWLFN